jgi:hypothetical protein
MYNFKKKYKSPKELRGKRIGMNTRKRMKRKNKENEENTTSRSEIPNIKQKSSRLIKYAKDSYKDDSELNAIKIIKTDNASASVYRNDITKKITVAFRGTDESRDWLDNVNIIPTTFEDLSAHSGFVNHLNKIYTATAAELKKYPNYDYELTGHSLGGATATLFAYKYYKETGKKPDNFVSFGSPRVIMGDDSKVRYNKEINHVRIANEKDTATQLTPPWSLSQLSNPEDYDGYIHTGTSYIGTSFFGTSRFRGVINKGKNYEEDRLSGYIKNKIKSGLQSYFFEQLIYVIASVTATGGVIPPEIIKQVKNLDPKILLNLDLPKNIWSNIIGQKERDVEEMNTSMEYNLESFEEDFGEYEELFDEFGDINKDGLATYFEDKKLVLEDLKNKEGYNYNKFIEDLNENLNYDDPDEESLNDFLIDADESMKKLISMKLIPEIKNIKLSVDISTKMTKWLKRTQTLGKIMMGIDLATDSMNTIKFHNLDKYEETISKMNEDEIKIEEEIPEVKVEEVLTMDPEPERTTIDDPTIPQSRVVETPSTSFFSQFLNLNFSKKDVLGLIKMEENEDFNFIVLD